MDVQVVLLPRYIGESEYSLSLSIRASEPVDALTEAKSAMKPIRKLEAGDVLVLPERFFIVEREGFREVSAAFCNSWRSKTSVERQIGCMEYERRRR